MTTFILRVNCEKINSKIKVTSGAISCPGFMTPKSADGEWVLNENEFDPIWSGGQGGREYYTEMNAWIYTFHVQQDMASGGTLVLEMGPEPSSWGSAPESAPPSMSVIK